MFKSKLQLNKKRSKNKKASDSKYEALLLSVAGTGLEPVTFGLCIPLQLSLLPAVRRHLWAGLSLHPRLYVRVLTIQSLHLPQLGQPRLGSGLPHYRLPRVWQVNTLKFPSMPPNVSSAPKLLGKLLNAAYIVACRFRSSVSRNRSLWIFSSIHNPADVAIS